MMMKQQEIYGCGSLFPRFVIPNTNFVYLEVRKSKNEIGFINLNICSVIPKVCYSKESLFRRFVIPKVCFSENEIGFDIPKVC